jgi:hypothetical protein
MSMLMDKVHLEMKIMDSVNSSDMYCPCWDNVHLDRLCDKEWEFIYNSGPGPKSRLDFDN